MEDVTVKTGLTNDVGVVKYKIDIGGLKDKETPLCTVNLLDADDKPVLKEPLHDSHGSIKVTSPKLWWPLYMSDNPGYLDFE